MIGLKQLLMDLVAIPSVNPSIDDSCPGGEQAVCERLRDLLERAGVGCETVEVLPGRPNLYASLDRGKSQTILLTAHTDVVPALDFAGDPFVPNFRDGCVYGRGSCDTKASLAAMALAVVTSASSGSSLCNYNVQFAAVCDEESGFSGSKAAADLVPADLALVGEPTGLQVLNQHKGVARSIVRSSGVSAHSSVPERGDNAIYRMAQAALAIAELNQEWSTSAQHALGPRTVALTTVRGGQAVNIIPDSCSAEIDVRLLPDDDTVSVSDQIRRVLPPEVSLGEPYLDAPGLYTDPALPLVRSLHALTGLPLAGAPFATDAAFFSRAGTPAVVIGPGDAKLAHTSGEHIPLSEVEAFLRMLLQFLQQ